MNPSELVKWRKQHRFTQKALADILGVTETTVFRWEKALRAIPSFLHLTLECLEKKGGVSKLKGKKTKKRKEEKK